MQFISKFLLSTIPLSVLTLQTSEHKSINITVNTYTYIAIIIQWLYLEFYCLHFSTLIIQYY